MNPTQIAANHAYYDSKVKQYPFHVRLLRTSELKLRPEVFQSECKSVMFIYVPLEHEFVWMFESEADVKIFSEWSRKR